MEDKEIASLDERIQRAAAEQTAKTYTLEGISGKSSEEISKMTSDQMEKLAKDCLEKMRDEAVNENKIVKLTWTDKNGEKQEAKIVPASLSTPQENAVKDGDAQSNVFLNGKQSTLKKVAKGIGTGIKTVDKGRRVINQKIEKHVDRAMSDFGR